MATAPITGCELRLPKATNVSFTIPEGGLVPGHWSAEAGEELPAEKAEQFQEFGTNFALAIATTPPVAREEIVFIASSPGVIHKFAAALNDTGTNTDIDFVLKKNGSTLMSSDLTIVHGDSDREVVDGTANLSSLAYVAGDVFSIQMVVTLGTGAAGPRAFMQKIDTVP